MREPHWGGRTWGGRSHRTSRDTAYLAPFRHLEAFAPGTEFQPELALDTFLKIINTNYKFTFQVETQLIGPIKTKDKTIKEIQN